MAIYELEGVRYELDIPRGEDPGPDLDHIASTPEHKARVAALRPPSPLEQSIRDNLPFSPTNRGESLTPDHALDEMATQQGALERAVKAPLGTVEAIGNMVTGFAGSAAHGVPAYIGARMTGAGHDESMDVFRQASQNATYSPRSNSGVVQADIAGKVFEWAKHKVMDAFAAGGNHPASAMGILGGPLMEKLIQSSLTESQKLEVDNIRRAIGEVAFGSEMGPRQLAQKIPARRRANAERIKREADAEAERIAEAQHADLMKGNKPFTEQATLPFEEPVGPMTPQAAAELVAPKGQIPPGVPRFRLDENGERQMVDSGRTIDMFEDPEVRRELADLHRFRMDDAQRSSRDGEIVDPRYPSELTGRGAITKDLQASGMTRSEAAETLRSQDRFPSNTALDEQGRPTRGREREGLPQERDPSEMTRYTDDERAADVSRRGAEIADDWNKGEAAPKVDVPPEKPGFLRDRIDQSIEEALRDFRENGAEKALGPKDRPVDGRDATPFSNTRAGRLDLDPAQRSARDVPLREATATLIETIAEATGGKTNFIPGEGFKPALQNFVRALVTEGSKTLREVRQAAKKHLGNLYEHAKPYLKEAWDYLRNLPAGMSIRDVSNRPISSVGGLNRQRGAVYIVDRGRKPVSVVDDHAALAHRGVNGPTKPYKDGLEKALVAVRVAQTEFPRIMSLVDEVRILPVDAVKTARKVYDSAVRQAMAAGSKLREAKKAGLSAIRTKLGANILDAYQTAIAEGKSTFKTNYGADKGWLGMAQHNPGGKNIIWLNVTHLLNHTIRHVLHTVFHEMVHISDDVRGRWDNARNVIGDWGDLPWEQRAEKLAAQAQHRLSNIDLPGENPRANRGPERSFHPIMGLDLAEGLNGQHPIDKTGTMHPEMSWDRPGYPTRAIGSGPRRIGPRRYQGGSWTPFASTSKSRSPYQQLRDNPKYKAIPDQVLRDIVAGKHKPGKYPTNNQVPKAALALEKIAGLQKLTDQYMMDPTPEALKKSLEGWAGGDVSGNLFRKVMQGKFSAKDHPVIAWASSAVHYYKNLYNRIMPDRILHGEHGTANAPAPGSFYHTWRQLKRSEKTSVNNVGQALNNVRTKATTFEIQEASRELNGRDLTPPELQAYHERTQAMQTVLKEFNDFLKANGKQEIHNLPNYWSPMEYGGAHLIIVKDPKTMEIVRLDGSYLKPFKRSLERKYPGMVVEMMERSRNPRANMEAFEIMVRHLSKDSRDTVREAVAEAMRKQGFRRHGETRKGYAGAKGTQGTDKASFQYEEIAEQYIRSAYEYIGNRHIDQAHAHMLASVEAARYKNAQRFALDGLDQARGGINAAFDEISHFVSDVAQKMVVGGSLGLLRVPKRFAGDVLQHANHVKTMMLIGLFNPIQIAAQFLQPAYAIPKSLAMLAEHGGMNSAQVSLAVTKAAWKTLHELTTSSKMDKDVLDRMGALDATFKFDWRSADTDVAAQSANTFDHMTGVSTLSAVEKHVVRSPTALMFLNVLREMGYDSFAKDPQQIYRMTKELTDQYTVTNRWYEKPQVFGRTGLVGEALSPLQSFSTTWIGMFREFSKLGVEGVKEFNTAKMLPVASFMAINALTAGLAGLVGVKEADLLISAYNSIAKDTIPTLSEMILDKTSGLSQKTMIRFGVLSDLLGVHIGSSLNAPSVTNSQAPGVQLLTDIAKAAVTLPKNDATIPERREAIKGLVPRFIGHGRVEDMMTPEGMPYQTNRGSGGYLRDKADRAARYFGTFTTKESERKAEIFAAKSEVKRISEHFGHAISAIGDNLIVENPQKVQMFVEELLGRGYSEKEIMKALQNDIKSKSLTEDNRMLGKGRTLRQQRISEILSKFRD